MQTGFVRKQFTGKKLGGLPNSPPSPIYLLASVGNRIGLGSDHRTIKIAGNEEIASLGKEVDKFLFLFPNRQIATPAFIRQLKYIMGGCAGKFKGSDDLPPEDAPVNPDQDEGETVAQEKEVGENKTEAPLVDVSEIKQEGEDPAAPEAAAVEPGKKEEAPVAKSEDKVDATSVITEEPDKETEKKESDDAPAKEANKDAPLVTV
ncbi:hypothetical protein OIU76_001113 [Salix suchowensis]|uniref:Uncharacterized protein n=1 Tax=Salix suchowensis TaxID=1278906 RepID=A0ABQ9BBD6_9ROSI|nr:hypothetical protein OIU76_001113 [Salix suchowensis]KAJ6376243.1 hypothetical protein OIU77_001086 [Salix suchowensis]